MKRVWPLAGLLWLLAVSTADAQSIEWVTSYDEGMRRAGETKRAVMIDFWADWCQPCLEMDRVVYPDPAVARLSSRFIFVRVDFDKEKRLVDRFRIYGIPTMVFIDPAGYVLASHPG